jgi:predicted O-methyltransferase YrrM
MALRNSLRRNSYRWLEGRGWHLLRSTPSAPVPDRRSLVDLDERVVELTGIDMRDTTQLNLLEEFSQWRTKLADLRMPQVFGAVDVEVLYAMVRRYKPRLMIEIKSGTSTRVAALALAANHNSGAEDGRIIAIDPEVDDALEADARISVVREHATAVPVEFFQQLAPFDILFIDTTHVLKTGSDVQYVLLTVLPSLPVGCLIHMHDIFLPREYPLDWLEQLRFPNEQYALQAFLAFNESFEVLWSTAYMHHNHPDRLSAVFHSYDPTSSRQGASFWMRRVK